MQLKRFTANYVITYVKILLEQYSKKGFEVNS